MRFCWHKKCILIVFTKRSYFQFFSIVLACQRTQMLINKYIYTKPLFSKTSSTTCRERDFLSYCKKKQKLGCTVLCWAGTNLAGLVEKRKASFLVFQACDQQRAVLHQSLWSVSSQAAGPRDNTDPALLLQSLNWSPGQQKGWRRFLPSVQSRFTRF